MLGNLYARIVKGEHAPRRHAKIDAELKSAQEDLRLSEIAVESGARVLENMTGMMRMISESDRGKNSK